MGEPALEISPLELNYVTLDMVGHVWDAQIDMIERGMSKGQSDWGTSDDLLAQIMEGNSQLWTVRRDMDIIAVVVISVRSNHHMTKLFVQLIAGRELPEWSALVQDNLVRMKEMVGADCIEASCRPGLAKYLKSIGWSQKAIIMELQ